MSSIEAVTLDLDGTLVSSNDQHARAFGEAAAELGVTAPGHDRARRLIESVRPDHAPASTHLIAAAPGDRGSRCGTVLDSRAQRCEGRPHFEVYVRPAVPERK